MKCGTLARNIFNAFNIFKSSNFNVAPEILEISPACQRSLVVIDKQGFGIHYIVRVGERVFDAYAGASGMSYSYYIKMLEKANLGMYIIKPISYESLVKAIE